METNAILAFVMILASVKRTLVVNSSGMNAMFDIPYNFRLSVKFSTHMINNLEKNRVQLYQLIQANSCASILRSLLH